MIKIIKDKSEHKNKICPVLTHIVFKECGITEGELVIKDWEIGQIYISEGEKEWTIKVWDLKENNKGRLVATWTLYLNYKSSSEENFGSGIAVFKT